MSESIDIRCPKCSSLMRLQRPQVTSQVQCPQCARAITVRPSGAVSTAVSKASFRRLPAKLVVSAPVPQVPLQTPPPDLYDEPDEETIRAEQQQQEHQARRAQARRKAAKRQFRTLTITVFATGLVIVGGLLLFVFRDEVFGKGKTLLVGPDDRQRVATEASATINKIAELLGAVQGARSRELAASTIEDSLDHLEYLTARAAALDPIAPEHYESEKENIRRIFTARGYDALQRGIQMAAGNKMHANDSLGVQLVSIQETMEQFLETCNASWRAIPPPESQLEEMEADLVGVLQKVWSELTIADSRSAFAQCGAIVNKADAYIQHVSNQNDAGPMFSRASRYHEPATFFASRIAQRVRNLRVQHGSPTNIGVFDRLVETLNLLVPVSSTEAEVTGTRYVANTEAAVFGTGYTPLEYQSSISTNRIAETFQRAPPAAKPSSEGIPPKSLTTGPATTASVDWESMLSSFRQKWKNEKIAVIWIRNPPKTNEFSRLVLGLRRQFRPHGLRFKISSGRGFIVMTYGDTMRSLAEQIDWANEIETHEQNRTMRVTYQAFF